MQRVKNRIETKRLNRIEFPTQDFSTVMCPNCGSAHVKTTRTENLTAATRRRTHNCERCPASWKSIQTIPITDRSDLKEVSTLPGTGKLITHQTPVDPKMGTVERGKTTPTPLMPVDITRLGRKQ